MSEERTVDIHKFRILKQAVDNYYNPIKSFIPLKNGGFGYTVCEEIRLFNPDNICKPFLVIKNDEYSYCLTQLEDGKILVGNEKIKIWEIDENEAFLQGTIKLKGRLWNLLLLPNDRMVASIDSHGIEIFKTTPPYTDTPIKEITKERVGYPIYIKERDELIFVECDKQLTQCWNMTNYQCIRSIKMPNSFSASFSIVDANRVIYNNYSRVFIVDLTKGSIEPLLEDDNFSSSKYGKGMMLRDGHTMLIGGEHLSLYDFKTKTLKKRQFDDSMKINQIIVINDNTLLTLTNDETKLQWWKY